MSSRTARINDDDEQHVWRLLAAGALRVAWQVVRLPILSVLIVLEPLVCFILSALSILGFFVALVMKLSGDVPSAHIWMMVAFSVGCALLILVYYAVMRLFSR
jgi:hypothetical protein